MSTDGSALGYPELLRLATSKGLTELDSTIVQIPSEANGGHGVVLASARTGTATYRAVGEAWRDALPPVQRAQTLTVAEVRAKTRALCEAVGMPQPLADSASLPATPEPVAMPRLATPRLAATPVPQPAVQPAVAPEALLPRPALASPPAVAASPARPDAELRRPGSGQNTSAPSPSGPVALPQDGATKPAGIGSALAMTTPAASRTPAAIAATAPGPVAVPREDAPPGRARAAGFGSDDEGVPAAPGKERTLSPRPVSRPAPNSPLGSEGIGPEITSKLLQMTRRIAELKEEEMNEEGALERLDSFFQRRFGHGIDQATRMEGQGVVQRLAAEVARLAHAPASDTA